MSTNSTATNRTEHDVDMLEACRLIRRCPKGTRYLVACAQVATQKAEPMHLGATKRAFGFVRVSRENAVEFVRDAYKDLPADYTVSIDAPNYPGGLCFIGRCA